MADTGLKKEKDLVSRLLRQVIVSICRETFTFNNTIEVDAMISITVDENPELQFIKFHKKLVNGKSKDSEKELSDNQRSKIEKPIEGQDDGMSANIKTDPNNKTEPDNKRETIINNRTEPIFKTELNIKTEPNNKTESEIKNKSEPKINTEPNIKTERNNKAQLNIKTETETKNKTKPYVNTEPDIKTEPYKETEIQIKTEPVADEELVKQSENVHISKKKVTEIFTGEKSYAATTGRDRMYGTLVKGERENMLRIQDCHEKPEQSFEEKLKSNQNIKQFQNIRRPNDKEVRSHVGMMTKQQADLVLAKVMSEQSNNNKSSASYSHNLQSSSDGLFSTQKIPQKVNSNPDSKHPEVRSGVSVLKVKQNLQRETAKDKPIDMSNNKQTSLLNLNPEKKELKRVHQQMNVNTKNPSKMYEAQTQMNFITSEYEEMTKLGEETASSIKRPKIYSEETILDSDVRNKMKPSPNMHVKTGSKPTALTNEEMQIAEKAMKTMAAFQSQIKNHEQRMPSQSHIAARPGNSTKRELLFYEKPSFQCNKCSFPCKSFSDFDNHMQRVHEKFTCMYCGNKLASHTNRERHYQTHLEREEKEEQKLFKCGVCKQTFYQKPFFDHHICNPSQ